MLAAQLLKQAFHLRLFVQITLAQRPVRVQAHKASLRIYIVKEAYGKVDRIPLIYPVCKKLCPVHFPWAHHQKTPPFHAVFRTFHKVTRVSVYKIVYLTSVVNVRGISAAVRIFLTDVPGVYSVSFMFVEKLHSLFLSDLTPGVK